MLLRMKKAHALVALSVSLAVSLASAQKANILTPKEKADGWRLLFDGKTTDGWRSARGGGFPKAGWAVNDGTITVTETGGEESGNGGHASRCAAGKALSIAGRDAIGDGPLIQDAEHPGSGGVLHRVHHYGHAARGRFRLEWRAAFEQ